MTSTFLRFALTSLAAIGVASCARATSGASTAPELDSARNGQLEAIYRARLDSARMRFTPADVHFMTSMIAHHAQAVVAARMAESHGASPSILTLAGRIINAQQDEIATMEQWLRDRRQPVPELHIEGTSVMMHGGMHVHMPGMLTAEQMRQLDEARDAEFDRLFLAYMIQHHRGAVTMVRDLFATDGAGQDEEVFKFASDVQVDQSTEVARMELMLAELTPADRTP
ncbi:MAG TPA: DUF305 domain-containing protein [Gemmatimonadaceae bacterium]|nr:DUF305 domain-containing protein [Gemmatimonadaceae bacterium]